MFFQGHQIGKKYGNKEYLQKKYPNLHYQDYQRIVHDKATKLQSLFIKNKFRTYNKPILQDRMNAKMIEKSKNLPKNVLASNFFF